MFDIENWASLAEQSRRPRLDVVIERQDKATRLKNPEALEEKLVRVRDVIENVEHANRVELLRSEDSRSHNITDNALPKRTRCLVHCLMARFDPSHVAKP
jgi:hypothetical protein